MGVKGLQYFTEEHCNDVCYRVSIKELALAHKIAHPENQPTIVVDGLSLLNLLYQGQGGYQDLIHPDQGKLEWLYGGQWLQFVDILTSFISRFQQIDVKLVFIFDGSVISAKRHEWIRRRLDKIPIHEDIFRKIKENHLPLTDESFKFPTSTGDLIRIVLKYHLNMEVYSSIEEADMEIAEYAKYDDSVFAILARDTDFFIFDTKYYLNVRYLNLNNMTTMLCDRVALARRLSLNITQLPLLACLLGNDMIPKDILNPFQYSVCRAAGGYNTNVTILAPAVSNIIRQRKWTGDINNELECKEIARIALGSENKLDLLQNGLKLYFVKPMSHIKARDLVEAKHVMTENLSNIYNVFCKKEYISSMVLEDSKDQSLPPAAIAYKGMNLRCYYILFSGRTDISIQEWLAYPTNKNFLQYQPNITSPMPFQTQGALITLENLWSADPKFDNARMEYFFKCLAIPVSLEHLNSIPKQYIVLCCILNYLLSNFPKILEMWEVVDFVVQAVHMQAVHVQDLYKMKITYVEPRAVQLASLFMRGVLAVVMTLNTCGVPFPLSSCFPWMFFDGKLFHHTYHKAKQNADLGILCENQEKRAEVVRVLHVVTYGTFLQ